MDTYGILWVWKWLEMIGNDMYDMSMVQSWSNHGPIFANPLKIQKRPYVPTCSNLRMTHVKLQKCWLGLPCPQSLSLSTHKIHVDCSKVVWRGSDTKFLQVCMNRRMLRILRSLNKDDTCCKGQGASFVVCGEIRLEHSQGSKILWLNPTRKLISWRMYNVWMFPLVSAIDEWSWNFFIFSVLSWVPCLFDKGKPEFDLHAMYELPECLLSDAVPQIADVIIEAHLASQVSRLRLPISRTLAQNMPETPETTVLCNIVQSIKWVWNRSCSFQQV